MSLVLAVGPSPPPVNGAAVINAAVSEALSQRTDVRVLDTSVACGDGPRYHLRRLGKHAAAGILIWRSRRSDPRRWLYVTSPGGLALWYIIALAAVARLCQYRVAVHHHSFAYLTRKSLAMSVLVRVCGAVGHHVLLCDIMRDRFHAEYHPTQPSLVCSNAAWMSASSVDTYDLEPRGDTLRIGHLSSLSVGKGLAELAGLVHALVMDGVDTELWLAGSPAQESDQRLLTGILRELGPKARWLGPVAGAEKARFFRDIDVFAFPTRYRHEAQPMVVFEALQAGVPVTSYSAGCVAGQVMSSGLIVSPSEDFAQHARPFLADVARSTPERMSQRRAALAAFAEGRMRGLEQRETLLRLLSDVAE